MIIMGLFSHEKNNDVNEQLKQFNQEELAKKALLYLSAKVSKEDYGYGDLGTILIHHDLQEQNKKLDKIIELLESK